MWILFISTLLVLVQNLPKIKKWHSHLGNMRWCTQQPWNAAVSWPSHASQRNATVLLQCGCIKSKWWKHPLISGKQINHWMMGVQHQTSHVQCEHRGCNEKRQKHQINFFYTTATNWHTFTPSTQYFKFANSPTDTEFPQHSYFPASTFSIKFPIAFLPFLPAHSISKLRMRTGAIFSQSPSAGCETRSSHDMSNSTWHLERYSWLLEAEPALLPASGRGRRRYFPAGISTQLHPTISQSTMNLKHGIHLFVVVGFSVELHFVAKLHPYWLFHTL